MPSAPTARWSNLPSWSTARSKSAFRRSTAWARSPSTEAGNARFASNSIPSACAPTTSRFWRSPRRSAPRIWSCPAARSIRASAKSWSAPPDASPARRTSTRSSSAPGAATRSSCAMSATRSTGAPHRTPLRLWTASPPWRWPRPSRPRWPRSRSCCRRTSGSPSPMTSRSSSKPRSPPSRSTWSWAGCSRRWSSSSSC